MFVRYISHEVRTPLNAVSMGLDLIRDELVAASAPAALLETVTDTKTSCDNAVVVLSDLLTFDKLENGTLKLELEEVDAVSVIKQTVQPFFVQVLITLYLFCYPLTC